MRSRLVVGAAALVAVAAAVDALHAHRGHSRPLVTRAPPVRLDCARSASSSGRARLGPVSLAVGRAPGSGAGDLSLGFGYPVQVVVRSAARLVLQGRRCGDGEPLRFWTRRGSPYSSVAASLAAGGHGGVLVRVEPPRRGHGRGERLLGLGRWRGWLLFPEPGTWELSLREAGQPLGTVQLAIARPGR